MANPPKSIKLMITGKMAVGKSLAVEYLVKEHQALRFTRSDLMKRVCHALIDNVGSLDDLLERLYPDKPDIQDSLRDQLLRYAAHYKPEPGKPRKLFQEVTDLVMGYNPLVYDLELATRIDSLKPTFKQPFYLIDDVRSLEAYEFYLEKGYKPLRIDAQLKVRRLRMLRRDGYLPSPETFSHPTEIALDQVEPFYRIENNNDTPEEMYKELDKLMAILRKGEE